MPTISLIAAVAENYVIGKDGELPWRLPADLKWFVEKTRGKPVIFGRRTYESTGFLKSRTNIVLTSRDDFEDERAVVVHTIDEALEAAKPADEIMILGGSSIYEQFMPIADRFYLTVVHARPDGDTRFPPIDASEWRIASEERREADELNPHAMTFLILERDSSSEPTEVERKRRLVDLRGSLDIDPEDLLLLRALDTWRHAGTADDD